MDQGLAVVSAALDKRGYRLDCSHLVHAIYKRAGFPYNYANSSELYAGTADFQQVTRPQPGDLIVWRGHVGIVINPSQHSFYSALRPGLGTATYDSGYWRRRGRARFFRYVRSSPVVNTAFAPQEQTLTPASFEAAEEPDNEPAMPIEPAPENVQLPRMQLINVSRPKPADVNAALITTFGANQQILRDGDPFKLAAPLVVFSSIEVKEVKLKGDLGWVEVRITEPVSVTGGQASTKKRLERQRWPLHRRDRNSWELVLPQDSVYIPQSNAVQVFAHRLATLTDGGSADAQEKSQLAQMLSTLLAP
jgi:hypothetical protein